MRNECSHHHQTGYDKLYIGVQLSIVKSFKCDFCGKCQKDLVDLYPLHLNKMHCCIDCCEVIETVLAETANYTMASGKVPNDKKEFSVMMYNLSLRAEDNK